MMRCPCHYCGVRGNPRLGIDRKDNDLCYTLANSVPCCKLCNRAKLTQTYEEFQSYLQRVATCVAEKNE